MEASFWHQKWKENDIGFHQGRVNSLLVKYFKSLALAEGKRVFLPLCGKTLDIAWLLSGGYCVVGVELNETAIEQLFSELKVEPQISDLGNLKYYYAKDIDIFVGDIFELSAEILGEVDAVYDRAALVALPAATRKRYTAHLTNITHNVPQLLISYEYDQSLIAGPPFSISATEIRQHYQSVYNITPLATVQVPEGMKGKCAADEHVWLLQNSSAH